MTKAKVLVLAERSGQELDSITLQLLGRGRELADCLGGRLGAIILGHQLGGPIDCLVGKVDNLYYVDHPALETYNAEILTKVLVEVAQDIRPRLFLFGYTYLGMELGPAIAIQLGMPLVTNCQAVELSGDGKATLERPLCGGMFSTRLGYNLPLMLSVPLSVFSAQSIRACQTTLFPVEYQGAGEDIRIRVREVVRRMAGDALITKADILISVGRGVGSPDRLRIFQELAQALGGAVACSRPVVDMGWLPPEHLVGLSGFTVKPRVYLACGISGAAQHLAGMSGSSTIIAINKDPSAPIFNVAHYGIVGDMFEVVPEFMREWVRQRQ